MRNDQIEFLERFRASSTRQTRLLATMSDSWVGPLILGGGVAALGGFIAGAISVVGARLAAVPLSRLFLLAHSAYCAARARSLGLSTSEIGQGMRENPPSTAEDRPSNGPTRVAAASEIARADSDLDAELEEMAADLLSTDPVELARWTEGTLQEIERRDDSSLRSLPVLDAQLVTDMVRWIPDDCSREADSANRINSRSRVLASRIATRWSTLNGVVVADQIMNELVSSELSQEDSSAYRRVTDDQRDDVAVALMLAARFADCSAIVRRPEGTNELDPDEQRAVAVLLDAVQEIASGAESKIGMSMTADGSFDSEVLDLPPISSCGVFLDGSPWLVDEMRTHWLGSSSSSDELVCASLVKRSRGYQLQTRSPIGFAAEKPPPLQFIRTEDWRRAFAGDRTRSGEIRSIEDSINTLERARSPRTPTASARTLDSH